MLLQRLCFSAFKSSHGPCFLTPLLTNPLANSDSLQLFQPNSKTLRLGFQRTISAHSHGIVSHNSTDSTINALKTPSFVREPYPDSTSRAEIFRALEASLGSAFSSQPAIPNPGPLIIVISGPSGVGKDAVIKRLREVRCDMHFVVTVTSRAKRDGEVDGKDYFFRTKDEFLAMIDRDELLEYALVYGDYKGIPKQQIRDFMSKGCDIVLRVDVQGAASLRRILRNSAVFVFLVAESEEALVKRLIGRKTETVEALLMRVASAKEELSHLREFDYVVVNKEGELENSVNVLESIIDAEKAKVHQRRAVI